MPVRAMRMALLAVVAVVATLAIGLAIGFRAVGRTRAVIALVIPAMAGAILRAGTMCRVPTRAVWVTLPAIVAVVAALAVVAAVGLRRSPLGPRLWSRFQPLECIGGLREVGRKRRDRDPLAGGALDVAQI